MSFAAALVATIAAREGPNSSQRPRKTLGEKQQHFDPEA